ncbi:MAG: hypothetical protein ACFFD4_25360, partial [Candidatus Odinarchaeota archaeon]
MSSDTKMELTGEVRKYYVDPVLKMQKIDLIEPKRKINFYIEVPLGVSNLEGIDILKITVEPEEGQAVDFSTVKFVLNADLYSTRSTESERRYFFSAGGLQFRIYSNE